jgi:hypothetical protein
VSRNADGYTQQEVERLIGLHEHWGPTADRHVTVADILSWARDPGGGVIAERLPTKRRRVDPDENPDVDLGTWMARRGPLRLDSDEACALWDFMRAFRRLELVEQAVVALTVMGFRRAEVANALSVSQATVTRVLFGREKRDHSGNIVKDEEGRPVRATGGAVRKLTRHMNGGRDAEAV